jgi:CubicO group peptidase (beta-lactamase class C family)
VRRAVAEVGKPEIDRSLLLPLRYSAGMMLGSGGWSLYGPDTAQAFGHLGFTNIVCWADPERATSVALLTTGKSAIGLHIPALASLLAKLSRLCPKLTVAEQDTRLAEVGLV